MSLLRVGLALLLLGGATLRAASVQWDNRVSQRFDYGLEVSASSQWRWQATNLTKRELMAELMWHYSPQWDFSVAAEQMTDWAGGMKMTQNYGVVGATYKLKQGPVWMESAVQLALGEDDQSTSLLELRNKTRVGTDAVKLPWGFRPFVQNEIYETLKPQAKLSQDTLKLGVARMINKALSVELSWGADFVKEETWRKTDLLGLGLNLAF